jgi:hypothetical protein
VCVCTETEKRSSVKIIFSSESYIYKVQQKRKEGVVLEFLVKQYLAC